MPTTTTTTTKRTIYRGQDGAVEYDDATGIYTVTVTGAGASASVQQQLDAYADLCVMLAATLDQERRMHQLADAMWERAQAEKAAADAADAADEGASNAAAER